MNTVITIRPARVATFHCAIILILTLIGIAARTKIYAVAPNFDEIGAAAPPITRFLSRFDLGFEPSVSAWFSSIALMAAAVLLLLTGLAQDRVANHYRNWRWYFLSILFVCLAIDEVVMFHETLSSVTKQLLGETSGALYFAWVIPGSAFVLALAVVFGRFVLQQPTDTRNLFFLAAIAFVGGAIGLELVEGVLYDQGHLASFAFTLVQAAEESLEMLGTAIFNYALLRRLELDSKTLQFRFAST